MTKRLIAALLGTMLLLSGCSNYRDLNEFDMVAGMAIDEGENGYRVTLELIDLEGSLKEDLQSTTVTLEGSTIPQALEQARSKLSREFHFGNMEIIVLGKEVAQEGILTLLDGFLRDVNIRETIQLAISLNDTAAEVISAQGRDLSVSSYALNQMIAQANDSQLEPREVSIYNALDSLETPGRSLILPAVKAEEEEQQTVIQLEGLAVFAHDRLSYVLPEEYIPFYLCAANRLRSHDLVFELPHQGGKSTILITENKTRRSFEEREGSLVFRLDIQAKGQLGQSVPGIDLGDPQTKASIEAAAAQELCNKMTEFLEYQRQQGDTNVAEWEYDVYLKDGPLWETIKSAMEETQTGISMEVNVAVEILDSGIVRGV